jgi:hypothetical protein
MNQNQINIARLPDALRAEYKCSDFNCIVRPEHRVDAVVGEPVALTLAVFGGSVRFEIVRAPESEPNNAAAQLTGNSIVCRKPGLYVVAIVLDAGFRREVEIAAWPKAAVGAVGFTDSMSVARRARLRAITRDANVTRESIVDALETPRAVDRHPVFGDSFPSAAFAAFVGRTPSAGIDLNAYGGGQ